MIDRIDKEILRILQGNSRLSWREIGSQIFLTGQAVRARVLRLQEKGILKKFTIKYEQEHEQIILFYMTTSSFERVESIFRHDSHVHEAYKTTGDSCYILKSSFESNEALEIFLSSLSFYGRYKVNIILKSIEMPEE